MKQIFTLLSMGMLCLASTQSFAQVNETFNTGLPTGCWYSNNVIATTGNGINGKSAEFTNTGTSELRTPYIDVTTGTVTINFKYLVTGSLSSNGNGQSGKTRSLNVGYQNKAGVFTSLTNAINITATTATNFIFNGSNTFSLPNGTYRIVIIENANGGNEKVWIDDLTVSGNSYHYGSSPCNTPPTANADSYNSTTNTYASVLTNDSDPNGEALTAELVTNSADGNVVLNADGTFTFTPITGFAGTKTTFTYRVKDNGYDPEYSATSATVTINTVPAPVILPIHLKNISGNLSNNKAQLTWSVADNETGSYFEIQKSVDGKKFENASIVFTSEKVGDETYTYTDANTNAAGTFYRLKVYNKDNSTSYSKVIYLKSLDATAANKVVLLQNPVQNSLSFSFAATVTESTEIAVYNMAGVKVYSQKITAQKGTNTITTDCNNKLSNGNYVLQVSNASGTATNKFIKY